MGSELGYTGLSLGENACKQVRVVARARARSPIYLSSLSDRSRAWVLSYLCLSLAAAEKQPFPPARLESDAGTNWRPGATFHSARRSDTRKLRSKQTRWRRISAHCPGRSRLHMRDRRRPGYGTRLHASRPALARYRRIQNPAMGNARWRDHAGRKI